MLGFSPLSAAPIASNEVQFSSPGNASGSIAPINLSAPTGSAKGKASASGSIASISLVAPNGTASNSGSSPAFASGAIRPIYLTAPAGSATGTPALTRTHRYAVIPSQRITLTNGAPARINF